MVAVLLAPELQRCRGEQTSLVGCKISQAVQMKVAVTVLSAVSFGWGLQLASRIPLPTIPFAIKLMPWLDRFLKLAILPSYLVGKVMRRFSWARAYLIKRDEWLVRHLLGTRGQIAFRRYQDWERGLSAGLPTYLATTSAQVGKTLESYKRWKRIQKAGLQISTLNPLSSH
jgi:hypothetical protein